LRATHRLLLLALVLPSPRAEGQTAAAVTLAEAVALAARHDPNVIQAQGNVRSAGAGVRSAWGSFLPSISGNASGGNSFSAGPSRIDERTGEILSGDQSSTSANFGLSAEIDLFTGFRRGADLRAARGREDESQAALRAAGARSALETSTDFFSALRSRELVTVRRESVRRAEEQLAVATARLSTRAATVQDSLRAVVELGQARLDLVAEEAQLAASEANLARRLGLPGRTAAQEDTTLRVLLSLPDTAALLAEAVAQAPAVSRADAAVRAADADLAAAKSGYFPRLVLGGDYSYAGSNRSSYTFFQSRQVRLGLSWPLFNRFQREEQVVQRAATRDAELARAADARREVAARLTGQLAALDAARQRIELTEVALEAARADVAVALERYRLGSITITDLNLSQSGLTRAEENRVTARFEYLRARAEIEAILGRRL
jgi:outer membrane protein